jgi:hypothetical protein
MEYLSCFNFDIQYIKGTSNKVADSLSRYYHSDTGDDIHPLYDYVNADIQLDPSGEDLPWNRVVEIHAISDNTRNRPLCEVTGEREIQAKEMANDQQDTGAPIDASEEEDDPTIFESISNGPELRKHIEKVTHFLDRVKHGYKKDTLFTEIVKKEKRYPSFTYRDGLLYTNNRRGQEVLCIPRVIT